MRPHLEDYPCPNCGSTDHSYGTSELPDDENDYTLTINCKCGHTYSIEFVLVNCDDY